MAWLLSYVRFLPSANRSIGITPAIASTADSDTVLYEHGILREPNLLTAAMHFRYFSILRISAHASVHLLLLLILLFALIVMHIGYAVFLMLKQFQNEQMIICLYKII